MKYLSVIDTKTNKFQHWVENCGWFEENENDGPSLFGVKEKPDRLTNGWKEGFRVVPVEFKYTKKKSKLKKPKLEDELIDAYKEIFRLEPDLEAIPIFGWGRYFMYELAGDSFEKSNEDGYASMVRSLDLYEHIDEEMMEKIDEKYGDRISSGDLCDYYPDRSQVTRKYDFDERGGMCLIAKRNEDNTIRIEAVTCDSPE